MSIFSEIWFYTSLSTSALTNVLSILTTEAPVAHQSARHSQRRSVELTCSSSQKPAIVHARFVQHKFTASSRRPDPLSPCRDAVTSVKQNAPVMSSAITTRGRKYSSRPPWWGQHPASTLWGFTPHTKLTTNVGKAAGTFRSSRAPTESDHHKLSSATHATRGKKECASHHARAALSSTNLRTASVTVADPLYQTRRGRSSAALAMGRRFCVRSDDSCLKNPSC